MTEGERCGDCLYWDHRAEAEVDDNTGYCMVHEMMKVRTSSCPQFKRRTRSAVQEYYNRLYNDGSEYEDIDGGDYDI